MKWANGGPWCVESVANSKVGGETFTTVELSGDDGTGSDATHTATVPGWFEFDVVAPADWPTTKARLPLQTEPAATQSGVVAVPVGQLGAGCFIRVLGSGPWRVVSATPSDDGHKTTLVLDTSASTDATVTFPASAVVELLPPLASSLLGV